MTLTATSSGLAILGLMLTALLGMAVFDRSDPAGHSLSQVWALGVDVALWILLSILMLLSTWRGNGTGRPAWVLPSVYLLAAAAQVAALALLGTARPDASFRLLLQVGLVVSPLFVIARTSWSLLPWAGRLAAAQSIDWWTLIPLLLLALLPWWPLARRSQQVAEARVLDREAARFEDEKHRQAVGLADLAGLREVRGFSTATPLSRIIFYMSSESPGLRDAARERARSIANRQAEAEQMLSAGDDRLLRQLAYLDLVAHTRDLPVIPADIAETDGRLNAVEARHAACLVRRNSLAGCPESAADRMVGGGRLRLPVELAQLIETTREFGNSRGTQYTGSR